MVEKADFVVIIAREGDSLYVVEQFRYPLKQQTIELPCECNPDADRRGRRR